MKKYILVAVIVFGFYGVVRAEDPAAPNHNNPSTSNANSNSSGSKTTNPSSDERFKKFFQAISACSVSSKPDFIRDVLPGITR